MKALAKALLEAFQSDFRYKFAKFCQLLEKTHEKQIDTNHLLVANKAAF